MSNSGGGCIVTALWLLLLRSGSARTATRSPRNGGRAPSPWASLARAAASSDGRRHRSSRIAIDLDLDFNRSFIFGREFGIVPRERPGLELGQQSTRGLVGRRCARHLCGTHDDAIAATPARSRSMKTLLNLTAFSNVSGVSAAAPVLDSLRSQFIQLQRTQQLLVHIFILHRRAVVVAPLHAVVNSAQIHRLRHNVVVVDEAQRFRLDLCGRQRVSLDAIVMAHRGHDRRVTHSTARPRATPH